MAGRSAKYNMGRRDEGPFIYHGGLPPPPPGMVGPVPPFGSHYDGPGGPPPFAPGPHDLAGLPPPPRRANPGPAPPMPSIMQIGEGRSQDSPWEGLNKHQSHKVTSVPSYSSLAKKEAPLYEELINFPRAKDKDDMRCVMCGLPPSDMCVIPRQNKDVCKDCDKATWQHADSQVYFKWCKGCKKFLKLSSFSQKLDAAKCDKCRERGRQSYLAKKGKDGEEGHHMPHHRHHHHHPHPHHPPHGHPHFPPGPHLLPPPPHHFAHGPPPPPHIRMSAFPGGPGLPPLGPLPPPPGMLHHPPHGRHAPFHESGSYSDGDDGDDTEDDEDGSREEQKPSVAASSRAAAAEKEEEEDEDEMEAEMDEDDDAADATLSKMKLSTNFHAPLAASSRASGDEAGSAPGTPGGSTSPTGASSPSGPAPAASPTPATPQTPRGDATSPAADSATLSSLIQSSTAEGGNNLAELARIHHRIVELEGKAEQVNSMNKQLQAAHEHNRRADGTIRELSIQLEALRQENTHLHVQLEQWCHRASHAEMVASGHPGHPAAPQFAAEGGVPVPMHSSDEAGEEEGGASKAIGAEATSSTFTAEHVEQAAAEKDKRNRSDSITAGAALLDGFKKQRVDSGLSINTGAASPTPGAAEGAGSSSTPSGGEAAAEGKEKEGIFGEGYETPRHAIKGSPTIAL